MESPSWAETSLQLTSRHQPGGLAALAVDESECVVVTDRLVSIPSRGSMGKACDGRPRRMLKVGSRLFMPLQLLFSPDHGSLVPEVVEIHYEDISHWRKGDIHPCRHD
ncbi:hypothetical protein TNCV_2257101 [Trichonephila clavipes]|nr:hypothetical protein TNCV_2257101 [Trichonephila clavipes]